MAFKKVENLDADKIFRVGEEDGSDNTVNSISGYYLGYKETLNQLNPERPNRIHYFSIEGTTVGIWGTAVMNRLLGTVPAPANPNNNSNGTAFMTTVTFAGLRPARKKGFKPSKNFDVGFDDENSISVNTALSAGFSTGEEDDEIENDFSKDTPNTTQTTAVAANPLLSRTARSTTINKEHANSLTSLLKKK